MRKVHDTQRRLDAPDIRRIRPNVRSRDDIPAILIGIQDPFSDEGTRKRLFGLPDRLVLPGKSRRVGRPGMDTGVWLTACRSSRRSFPTRSEGWSWRGATGWPEKSLAPRCAAAVIPSWPGPTCIIRPTAACRWTRRGAWSGTCPGPAGGLGHPVGGGRNTFAENSGKATSGWPRHGSPTAARGTWRRGSGWR